MIVAVMVMVVVITITIPVTVPVPVGVERGRGCLGCRIDHRRLDLIDRPVDRTDRRNG